MKTKYAIQPIAVVAACLCLSGCARFSTVQTDYSYDENGWVMREVRTVTRASTFLDSKSKLTELATSQTDKTQSTKVGSLETESSSAALEAIAKGAAEGAVKGMKP